MIFLPIFPYLRVFEILPIFPYLRVFSHISAVFFPYLRILINKNWKMSKYHSAEIWENNAEIWEKIIFDRGDMGKYVKNHKRGDMGKYR
jgi:hypothetical protein